MTKQEKIYVGALLALFVIMIILEMAQPRPINWSHTYHKNDKIPYGNFLLYSMLDEETYPNNVLEITDSYFEEKENGRSFNANEQLLFIGDTYEPNEQDLDILLSFVAKGGQAFLVANNFPEVLEDTLGFYTNTDFFFQATNENSKSGNDDGEGNVPVNFVENDLKTEEGYLFKRTSVTYYFSQKDGQVPFNKLANNHNNKPSFISFNFGDGTFFLHCNPLMFTNYHMLTKMGNSYISSALSYLSNGTILWDTYQQGLKLEPQTPIRFILQQLPLRWAWYLTLLLIGLWIIFQSKRRQRKIPVEVPPANATLEFVDTISKLYFQQRQHHKLARKKIKFLKDGLKKKYFVNVDEKMGDSIDKIHRLSSLKRDEIIKMMEFISVIELKEPISEEELQLLENYSTKLMDV